MVKATIDEFERRFIEYVDVVARGETVTLLRNGRPVAELRPVSAGLPLSDLPAVLASLPSLSAGDADDFARDLEAARTALAHRPVEDRWAS